MPKNKRIRNTKSERRRRVEFFLSNYRPILNITGLESETGLPQGSIQKYYSESRIIRDTRIKIIDTYLLEIFKDFLVD